MKEASDMVAHLPGSVERQVYAMRVASMAGVASDVVAQEVEQRSCTMKIPNPPRPRRAS